MEINIVRIYPELLNHYGDKGNIVTLKKRLEDRGIKANILSYESEDRIDFENADLVYIGGGTDKAFMLAYRALLKQKEQLSLYIENEKPILCMCNGFEMLGNEFEFEGNSYEGLGILDMKVKESNTRFIGNIVIKSDNLKMTIVGFENHRGRVITKSLKSLGNVLYGYGNDKKSEGIIYKNLIGTYIHGPLLPKNPALADHILETAIRKKYGECTLNPLDDSIENKAHDFIVNTYTKKNTP